MEIRCMLCRSFLILKRHSHPRISCKTFQLNQNCLMTCLSTRRHPSTRPHLSSLQEADGFQLKSLQGAFQLKGFHRNQTSSPLEQNTSILQTGFSALWSRTTDNNHGTPCRPHQNQVQSGRCMSCTCQNSLGNTRSCRLDSFHRQCK